LEFEYKPGPVFSNFILIDEINRSPAKTQAALFELMEERQITIDGTSYPMQEPFMVVATQNPIEQEGTYRLPEAQLDRFLLKVVVNYPSFEEELEMLKRFNYQKATDSIVDFQPVLSQEKLIELRQLVKAVLMDDNLLKYIAQITQVSRSNNQLELGISPRAAIAWMTASKAYAALQGRDFVTPDDIKSISNAVLRHRLILTPDAEMEGITADELLEGIINKTEIPR
jgi:MoxR-like ATPase